jgi:hypothetical protein
MTYQMNKDMFHRPSTTPSGLFGSLVDVGVLAAGYMPPHESCVMRFHAAHNMKVAWVVM